MEIVFASDNVNKIQEVAAMLPPDIQILSLKAIGCHEEIPETAATIEGNAILKADYVTQRYGYDSFADDTGLEVEALNGEPGVHSARYAGDHRDTSANIEKLLKELTNSDNRKARFKTVIALNISGAQHLFTGIVEGVISKKPSGSKGFGYDPVFIPDGYEISFAEMRPEEKAALSHRGKAVAQLIEFLKGT